LIQKVSWPSTARRRTPLWRTLLALVALVAVWGLLLALSPSPAHADATVNRTGDAPDMNPGNGRCDTSTNRGIQCTLRAAIQEVNVTETFADPDVIKFNIGGTNSVKTISPLSPLPEITGPTFIDGYTQRGARQNTREVGNNAVLKVQLNGSGADPDTSGLRITDSSSTIKGLVINRFARGGIEIAGSEASFNQVEGNFLGTNAAGTQKLGNFLENVIISGGSNNAIGGTEPAQRNVISGSSRGGVSIGGAEATGNRVEGNYIGTDKTGTADLGNNGHGVRIGDAADDNTVGGTATGARNVISGSTSDGVLMSTTFPTSDLATGNEVLGNFIGTTADGSGDLGNDNAGVTISLGTSNTTVGGMAREAGNRIAHNGEDGVVIFNSVRNSVLSNQIFSNGSTTGDLGIDLDFTGVTENDDHDLDAGSNNKQNFPVITSVTQSSQLLNPTRVSGTLNSTPDQDFTVQCFLASETPEGADPSGHGEGQAFMAQDTDVTTGEEGNADFDCDFLFPVSLAGKRWSATATNEATGDTSEFSANFPTGSGP
jgi:CSLREA domain-containing protein